MAFPLKRSANCRNGVIQAFLKEGLDNSLSDNLREILSRNDFSENDLTFFKLGSSRNGISAQKIRKLPEWSYSGFPSTTANALLLIAASLYEPYLIFS